MLSLFKNDLKQLKDFVVIYLGCLILNFIISVLSYHEEIPIITFYLIVFIFTLIMPMINLKYLFNATRQTHFNSLPFTRIQSFLIHYLSGIICLIIPAIIYCVLIQGVVLKNSFVLLLMIFMYYTLANLSAYLTTSFFMNIVLQAIIIITPLTLYFSLFAVYASFIKGVVSSGLSLDMISYLMPFVKLIIAGKIGLEGKYYLIYLGYLIITFVLLLYVCKHRRCSDNYYGFTYKTLAKIIKMFIIISGSWILTSVLGVSSASIKTFIMVNVIATVIVTFIVQFIHFRKIRYQLCIVQSALIILATVLIFVFSKSYLENYIPSSIASAVIERNVGNVQSNIRITNDQAIDKIIKIHKQLIDANDLNYTQRKINITYYRSNGSKVVRQYSISDYEYKKIVKEIDGDLIKSWNGEYYQLLKQIDKCQELQFYTEEDSYTIKSKDDLRLFKSILEHKLTDFENKPSLLEKVTYNEGNSCDVILKNMIKSYYYNINDPLFMALEDFYKIKAN